MGTVTVYFVGVCTHLRERASLDVDHRVVLINASGGAEINGHRIDPHLAQLWLDGRTTRPLEGVHLSLNVRQAGVSYEHSFETCIPRALAFAPDLPAVDEGVVRGRDPERVAAYFDADGRFAGAVDPNGASLAILTVDTDDPPRLTITAFAGGAVEEIELEDGARLQVANLGHTTAADRDHDFLLNYKIAQSIPANAGWPTERMRCGLVEPPYRYNTVGPGCSNSNYP